MTDRGGDEPEELSAGRKLRVLPYVIGAVGVLAAVGVLGFQVVAP